jgi:hypothetical protein
MFIDLLSIPCRSHGTNLKETAHLDYDIILLSHCPAYFFVSPTFGGSIPETGNPGETQKKNKWHFIVNIVLAAVSLVIALYYLFKV